MSRNEDYLLCLNHREGQDALDKLIKRHAGLARKWAKKFITRYSGCTIEDLVQECNYGIIDAARRYDPAKGGFTTYATQWMRKRCLLLVDTRLKNTSTGYDQLHDHLPQIVSDKEDFIEHCDSCGQLMIDHECRSNSDWMQSINQLYLKQLIDDRTLAIMKVICGTTEERQTTFRLLMADWWKSTKAKAIRMVGIAQSKSLKDKQRRIKRRELFE